MKYVKIKHLSIAERFEKLNTELLYVKKLWEDASENGGNVIEFYDAMIDRTKELVQLKQSFAPQVDVRVMRRNFYENGFNKIELTSFAIFDENVVFFDRLIVNDFNDSNFIPCVSCGDLILPEAANCKTCNGPYTSINFIRIL